MRGNKSQGGIGDERERKRGAGKAKRRKSMRKRNSINSQEKFSSTSQVGGWTSKDQTII